MSKNRIKGITTFLKNIIFVFSIPATLIALIFLIFVFMGLRPYILQSSSMEPMYPAGSFCVVDTQNKIEELKKNDVIAYVAGRSIVLHRIVGVGDGEVELKGDANENSQSVKLDEANYVGRLKWSIPGMGKKVENFEEKWVWLVVGILIIFACLPSRSSPTPSTPPKPTNINTEEAKANTKTNTEEEAK